MRARTDERGVIAILYALLALLLMGTAALAVDIGNGVSRKSDIQGQVDFAALAAGRPMGAQTSGTVPQAVLDVVRTQLNDNRVLNDDGTCRVQAPCVATNAQLVDGDLTNGEVRFCSGLNTPAAGCRKAGLQVIAPNAKVDFGFATVFGMNSIDVAATATVFAGSSSVGMMPVYAVTGCDFGTQTITDPPSGQVQGPNIPQLAFDTDTNDTRLDPASATPAQVPIWHTGDTSAQVTFSGQGFNHVTMVGFFPSDGSAGLFVNAFTPAPPYTSGGPNSNGSITVTVPTTVQSNQQVWYIRVFGDKTTGSGSNQVVTQAWSDKTQAPVVRVGDPPLECAGVSSDGNFGTIKLERTDVSSVNDQLAMNMATALQLPTTLTIHTTATVSGLCANGVNNAVETDLPNPGQQAGTNCLDTDTGLPASATTAGLVTGVGSTPGRLVGHNTKAGCDPQGNSSNRNIQFGNGNGPNNPTYSINNDTITCFLTNGTTSLQDIASPTYCSGQSLCPVLDKSILDSPRFFLVPVLRVTPVTGGSNRYSIIDFRPAFITDETVTPGTIRGTHTASPDNGLTVVGNEIRTVKVFFFNYKAVDWPTDGAITTYLGMGDPIIRLVD